MRFATSQGFNSGSQFYDYLKDTFDCLYYEGKMGYPKMMSIGLHCRLAGRPGRVQAIKKFIEYTRKHNKVWYAKRIDIAKFWKKTFPPSLFNNRPSEMTKLQFIKTFQNVFEHSKWGWRPKWGLRAKRILGHTPVFLQEKWGFWCFMARLATSGDIIKGNNNILVSVN